MPRRPMTAEDLWALPRVGAPVPSPDGSRLVVAVTEYSLATNEGTTRLWLASTDGRGRPRALTGADSSSEQPAWSPDGERIAFVRKHDDKKQLYVMPLDGGEAERKTDLPLGVVDPQWFPDGRRIAFLSPVFLDAKTPEKIAAKLDAQKDEPNHRTTEERFYRLWDIWLTDGKRHHIFVLDLETGAVNDLTPTFRGWIDPVEPVGHYAIAPDGKEIAFSATRSRPPHDPLLWGVYRLKVPARGRPRAPLDITPKDYAFAYRPRYSPDGRHLLLGARKNPYTWAEGFWLMLHDRRTRRTRLLVPRWTLQPEEWAFGDNKSVLCTADVDGRMGIFRLGFKSARPKELARGGAFAGLRVAGRRIFSSVSTLRAPPEAISLARDGTDRKKHTSFTAPLLRQLALAKVKNIVFRGAGDAPVQMFLLQPAGKKKPPLVHFIHGGPHGAFGDQWHWRWCAQAVAAQGYAVACVNFHGSTGFGRDFTKSISGEWGDKPYTDIMRATDHLVDRGLVDPKRMAATGGSYGGYLSSWIASQTDRFACIINHAGVCDVQTQFACDVPQGWAVSAGGDLWKNQEGLDRYNPLRHAKGFQSPMLVLHGELDYRVPYYQALQIYNVYKTRKVPARLVCYPDENHWILKPRNSIHWYGEFLGWLERWFKAR